jgi:lysophospholipase L1-like esterase
VYKRQRGLGDVYKRQAPIEPRMPLAEIVLVAPPKMKAACGNMVDKFADGESKSAGLAHALAQVAQEQQVHFFDANSVIHTSKIDGVHLDADQHLILGQALAGFVTTLLNKA